MLKICQGYEVTGKKGADFCSPTVDNVSMSPGKKGHLLNGQGQKIRHLMTKDQGINSSGTVIQSCVSGLHGGFTEGPVLLSPLWLTTFMHPCNMRGSCPLGGVIIMKEKMGTKPMKRKTAQHLNWQLHIFLPDLL